MARALGDHEPRNSGCTIGRRLTTRHVIVDLLASAQVARMNAGWLVAWPPGSRPTLLRFWGTACKNGEAAYLALFGNDPCLLLPLSR